MAKISMHQKIDISQVVIRDRKVGDMIVTRSTHLPVISATVLLTNGSDC